MDRRSIKIFGGQHRSERHDPKDVEMAIHVFGSKYGTDIVREIFNDHLALDARERQYSKSERDKIYTGYIPRREIDWIYYILLSFPVGAIIILFVYIFSSAFGNPIGLWWDKNWFYVVGSIIAIILILIFTVLFKGKNRIADLLWKIANSIDDALEEVAIF